MHRNLSESGISLISRPVKMSEKSATCAPRNSTRQLILDLGEIRCVVLAHLEVAFVGEGVGDALAGVDSERVATKADLLEVGDLTELNQVGLDRGQVVKPED